MKYFYNRDFGLLIYPHTWWDVLRLWLVRLILPGFKNTWPDSNHWWRPSTHTIERELKESDYPNLAGS